MKKIIFVFFVLYCSILFSQSTDSNLFNTQNTLRFADYLINTFQYDFAAEELERIAFLNPGNDSVKTLLQSVFWKSGKYAEGISKSELLFPETEKMPYKAGLTYSKMLLKNRDFFKAEKFINTTNSLSAEDKLWFSLASKMLEMKWDSAKFNLAANSGSENSKIKNMENLINESLELKYKSPFLALSLSTLVPGSGKAYSGRWKDGLFSFIIVGTSVWQSYRGFNRNGVSSAYGWIFGSLAFGFYSANIFGSYNTAKHYNNSLRKKITDKVEVYLSDYN